MANVSVKVGKRFEQDMYNSCPEDMAMVRLQDGKGTAKNPCDYILLTKDKGFMLEMKTTKEKRLPKANIKEHQLAILAEARRVGIGAYFIVNFREYDETYVADPLWVEMQFKTRKSIPVADFREHCILLPQEKKRTRFTYNLDLFRR